MNKELVCWHCGASLRDLPRPLRSSMRCPQCQADLHVCRLCRYYDPRYIGGCSHDRADKVLDKQRANYCTHFTPKPGAFEDPAHEPYSQARDALATLFGDESAATGDDPAEDSPLSPAERARREAEALFAPKPPPKSE